jgi:hypothetical protein
MREREKLPDKKAMQTHVGKKSDAHDAPCLDAFISTKAMQTTHVACQTAASNATHHAFFLGM